MGCVGDVAVVGNGGFNDGTIIMLACHVTTERRLVESVILLML